MTVVLRSSCGHRSATASGFWTAMLMEAGPCDPPRQCQAVFHWMQRRANRVPESVRHTHSRRSAARFVTVSPHAFSHDERVQREISPSGACSARAAP